MSPVKITNTNQKTRKLVFLPTVEKNCKTSYSPSPLELNVTLTEYFHNMVTCMSKSQASILVPRYFNPVIYDHSINLLHQVRREKTEFLVNQYFVVQVQWRRRTGIVHKAKNRRRGGGIYK
jgi:hypothetical protein